MARKLISSGSKYEEMGAYSRAVVQGDWVFMSGTAGFDPDGTYPPDPVKQAENIFATNLKAMKQAGATLADVVQNRVYVSDPQHVGPVCGVLKKYFDKHRPTNTTLVVNFAGPDMLVEMEWTCYLPGRSAAQPAAKRPAAKKKAVKKAVKKTAKKKAAKKK